VKTAPLAVLVSLVMLSACGKVGDPLPPIVRIPVKVENLNATQIGNRVILTWTNPAKYVDGNPASDLGAVHIFQNNVPLGMVPAGPAGQQQSFAVDVSPSNIGRTLTFTIQMGVPRNGTALPVSNPFPITPIEVPAAPRDLRETVDQGKIVLEWRPPEQKPELAEAYLVQRTEPAASQMVSALRYESSDYEAGNTYSYTVTAMRGTTPGGSVSRTFEARDTKPPSKPTGLSVQLIGGDAVVIRWNENMESDLRGYQLYRSDRPTAPQFTATNGTQDSEYMPGTGLSYRIEAIDNFGNRSEPSDPQPGP
jgi:hypothetical protein